jgi:hypothetical protein
MNITSYSINNMQDEYEKLKQFSLYVLKFVKISLLI